MATSKSSVIGDLYTYLLEKDARVAASSGAEQQFRTSEQRKRLSRRLRECLMKEFTLVGIPLVLGAISALAAVEKAEDADATFTRCVTPISFSSGLLPFCCSLCSMIDN